MASRRQFDVDKAIYFLRCFIHGEAIYLVYNSMCVCFKASVDYMIFITRV